MEEEEGGGGVAPFLKSKGPHLAGEEKESDQVDLRVGRCWFSRSFHLLPPCFHLQAKQAIPGTIRHTSSHSGLRLSLYHSQLQSLALFGPTIL